MTRGISQLLTHYGMAIVLLLLCIYYSFATLQPSFPNFDDAVSQVAQSIADRNAKNVVIVAAPTDEDIGFMQRVGLRLKGDGISSIVISDATPPLARQKLLELTAGTYRPDAIAASSQTSLWLPRVLENIPAVKDIPIISPQPRRFPTFLQKDNLLNIANQIVVIAIIAVGMTMVIITGGIDLSAGSLVALTAVIAGALIRDHGGGANASTMSLVVCSLAAILAAGLVGAFSGAMITFFDIPPFIVTLGMMLVASGRAYIFAAGQSIYDIPQSFTALSRNGIFVLVLAYAIAHIVMSHTKLGRYIYAVGGNAEAARLSGVRVGVILMTVYIVSGMMAGLGGIILASQLKSSAPTYGLSYELYVIAAVVVGGTSLSGGEGRVLGTLIGALIIAVIQNGMNLTGVDPYRQKEVLGWVILGAVLLDRLKKRSWKLPRFFRRVDSTDTTKESHAPIS
jgi:ribose transport system permease protein